MLTFFFKYVFKYFANRKIDTKFTKSLSEIVPDDFNEILFENCRIYYFDH